MKKQLTREVSIIIPAYNEEDSLEPTINSILQSVKVENYEILICNDHSTDKTLNIARKIAKKYPHVRVLSNTNNKGFGNVVRFGFKNAQGTYIVPMMADLCDDPNTINDMYAKIKEGYDVVVGSRYMQRNGKRNVHNKLKSFCSRLIGLIGWYVLNIPTHDLTNPFKLMKKTAVDAVQLTSDTFDISLELTIKLHNKGYAMTEVPTVWMDRVAGTSKFNVLKLAKRYLRWLFI